MFTIYVVNYAVGEETFAHKSCQSCLEPVTVCNILYFYTGTPGSLEGCGR